MVCIYLQDFPKVLNSIKDEKKWIFWPLTIEYLPCLSIALPIKWCKQQTSTMSKNVSATSRKKFNDNKSHRVFSCLILYLCSCSFVISNYFIFAFFQSIWIFETIFIFHKSEAATIGNYSLFSSLCLYIVALDIRCWQLTDPSWWILSKYELCCYRSLPMLALGEPGDLVL